MLGRLVASAGHCRCELPGDAGVLERIGQTVPAMRWRASLSPGRCRAETSFGYGGRLCRRSPGSAGAVRLPFLVGRRRRAWLNVPPPSRSASEVETELGSPLLERGQRGPEASDLAVDARQLGLILPFIDVTVAVASPGEGLDLPAEQSQPRVPCIAAWRLCSVPASIAS